MGSQRPPGHRGQHCGGDGCPWGTDAFVRAGLIGFPALLYTHAHTCGRWPVDGMDSKREKKNGVGARDAAKKVAQMRNEAAGVEK